MRETSMKDVIGLEVIRYNKPAYVAQCDRTLGLTLHYTETEEETLCINRAQLIEIGKKWGQCEAIMNRLFHEAMTYRINQILNGEALNNTITFDGKKVVLEIEEGYGACGIAQNCAFK